MVKSMVKFNKTLTMPIGKLTIEQHLVAGITDSDPPRQR